ncbi:MAG: hypothetical protein AAF489_00260 [Bacteroidota bacterium]
MENKLFAITPQYSSFVDDQVLTSHQLNEFIEYFKEQDHLTRVCLSGVGIVCGFDISEGSDDGEATIIVTQGCGITTDGDLIKLQRNKDGEFDKSTKDSKELVTVEEVYKYHKPFTDEKAAYEKFIGEEGIIDLIELIPIGEGDDEEDEKIDDLDLSDKVVILYLEHYQKEPSICTGSNCDNQGQENVQNVKVLLASKDDVVNVINDTDDIFTKHDVFEALTALPETAVPKVILNGGLGAGNNIDNYSDMASSFRSAITTAKLDLHQAYTDLFDTFADLLSINNGTKVTVLNQIDSLDDFGPDESVQYRYDLVRDLSDTYNEILKLLLKLKTECCPNIEAFPKHLLLGCIVPTQSDYLELRHQWYPSPTNTEYEKYIRLARSLSRRVILVLDNFSLSNAERIEITPSKSCSNLGEKAIPVYYNIDVPLLKSWDFCKTENLKQEYNLSYHKDLLAPGGWVQNPLDVSLDCHDFFRIEGHFGRPGLASRDRINEIRNDFALDFDCLLFDLATSKEEFTAFVKKNPSISHKAGVEHGGTFILIAEDDEVVADYCLSYKVVADPAEQGCCSLMECTFPWISSLKYMNNLSRSLLGTQSRNKPMPTHYILQVIEYRINGERLITGTTTLRIPLQQIFLRRMHAVTEALNNRFDKGVVFDFNESQKRFVITRAKEDSYVIRFREVTMSNSNAIYTYSNSGMFRNNKTFRADAMRCRDLKGYNPSFYEKLHDQIAPINKDDDYGSYDEKWRKWSRLTERLITNEILVENGFTRMISTIADLNTALEGAFSISNLKSALEAAAIDETGQERELRIHLDGDWVNGTWVNNFMLNHHRRNILNTHDDIVLFVSLRKALHNETGFTKLSIYIENQEYNSNFDAVLEEFNSFVDIYFCARPTGINAMRI